MAWDGVLVRFGEIGIKSPPVRRTMLEALRRRLLDGMERAGVEGDVHRLGPRLWMVGPQPEALARVAARTFGVVSASAASSLRTDLDAICAAAAGLAVAQEGWQRFAIRARRDGTHSFSSQDVAVRAGSAVWEAVEAAGRPVSVDLDAPELEVHVDIRQDRTYLFFDALAGPGGLPVGTQGTVVLLLSDVPSAVAAWLLMRRGCRLLPVHAGDTGSVPTEVVDALAAWGMTRDVEVLPVCAGTTTKEALQEAATRIAAEHEAKAIATGERTHSRLVAAPVPVLRPVCGLDEASVQAFARRAGVAGLPEAPSPWGDGPAGDGEDADGLLRLRRTVSV